MLFLGCQISAKVSDFSADVIKGAETGDTYHCIVYHWEPKDKSSIILVVFKCQDGKLMSIVLLKVRAV